MSNATFEKKFKHFISEINKCPYELPAELHPHFKNALVSAGFDQIDQSTTATNSSSGVKSRKLSGYNVYMKEKMEELKQQEVPSGERMVKVSTMWKSADETEKDIYRNQAIEQNALVSTTNTDSAVDSKSKSVKPKKSGPTKLSGYHVYVKEQMPILKEDTSIIHKERMGKIGGSWKLLSTTEQEVYKQKAKEMNEKAVLESTN